MNKKSLEIITVAGAVVLFYILIMLSKLLMKSSAGFGFSGALLIFILLMGFAGLKLVDIPDK